MTARTVVRAGDPVYERDAEREVEFWSGTRFSALLEASAAARRLTNADYTGHADVSWLDHLMRRGPYRTAATLGCCEADHESEWLRSGASEQLDVFDLSDGVLQKVRMRLHDGRFAFPQARTASASSRPTSTSSTSRPTTTT